MPIEESKNLRFWLFPQLKETADSVKEPAKNSRFLTVLWLFYLKNKKWWLYMRTGSLILWGSSCEIQASAVLITTRVLFPFLIPTHLLVRTYMVFHIYSTSFARFYVIVTWGVDDPSFHFMGLIWRWNASSLLSTIWCEKMATISR